MNLLLDKFQNSLGTLYYFTTNPIVFFFSPFFFVYSNYFSCGHLDKWHQTLHNQQALLNKEESVNIQKGKISHTSSKQVKFSTLVSYIAYADEIQDNRQKEYQMDGDRTEGRENGHNLLR